MQRDAVAALRRVIYESGKWRCESEDDELTFIRAVQHVLAVAEPKPRDVVVKELYAALTALDQLASANDAYTGSLGQRVKAKVDRAMALAQTTGVKTAA